VTCDIS